MKLFQLVNCYATKNIPFLMTQMFFTNYESAQSRCSFGYVILISRFLELQVNLSQVG